MSTLLTTSDTMCARRIFEVTACGTPVVSTPSPAIDAVFPGDEVAQVSTQREAEFVLRALVENSDHRDRIVHRAQRRIWDAHTYSHRVNDVLDAVHLEDHRIQSRRRITAIVSSIRPNQVDHVLKSLGDQQHVDLQVAFLAHGWPVDESELKERAHTHGLDDVIVLSADMDVPLGACLNRLVQSAEADVVAKVDDDDFYGPDYLSDQLYALDYSQADVVGKRAHYVHLTGPAVTALRFPAYEHQYTHFVMGPTIVARRDVALECPFPEVSVGEDTAFLESVLKAGYRIYSADRFNFAQVRGGTVHTWQISDAEVLASASVRDFSPNLDHVIV